MIYIVDLWNKKAAESKTIIEQHIQPPVTALLESRGPLAEKGLRYFLEARYDLNMDSDSYRFALKTLNRAGIIEKFWADAEYCYALPGQAQKPLIPVPADYGDAYYALYERYQAIRNNPELATVSEDYIDALYKPAPEFGGEATS